MGTWKVGSRVAVVRVADGAVLATPTIDKTTDREIRTETPYEQREHNRELSRRYWRVEAPHSEMRVPRNESPRRAACIIRPATEADIATAQRRVEVRYAKERMPRALRDKEAAECRIRLAEEALRREREPYERLLARIAEDEKLIADDSS